MQSGQWAVILRQVAWWARETVGVMSTARSAHGGPQRIQSPELVTFTLGWRSQRPLLKEVLDDFLLCVIGPIQGKYWIFFLVVKYMDREAWHAVIYGVAKSQTWVSDWTELHWNVWQYSLFRWKGSWEGRYWAVTKILRTWSSLQLGKILS